MGRFQSFAIKNFRGIDSLKINIDKIPVMLLGLNESGKSTILEAISHFGFPEEKLDADVSNLIPIHLQGQFSEPILVTAELKLCDDEKSTAAKLLGADNRSLQACSRIKITIDLKNPSLVIVETGVGTPARLQPRQLADIVPRVMYFRDLSIDIPEKIFLRSGHEDTLDMAFHRKAIENIIGEKYPAGSTLQNLVIDRIEDCRIRNPGDLAGAIGRSAEIKAVLARIVGHINERMADTWHKTFIEKNLRDLRIEAMVGYDADIKCAYLSYQVTHGGITYPVSARSSGFRWFFSFLLSSFSQSANALLLYDEPGNHLHGKAQVQMVEMLKRMSKSRQVIYSTHRPHLIEPAWLDSAYIVENEAYTSPGRNWLRPTSVVVTQYPRLVGEYGVRARPEAVSLASPFQPVIERLLINAPTILEVDDCVLVEGKSDYYVYRYFASLHPQPLPRFYPTTGAPNLGPLISLLIGRRARFIVLCDGDRAGVKSVKSYRDHYLEYRRAKFLSLDDIDQKFANFTLEDLISKQTIANIGRLLGIAPRDKKIVLKAFNLLLSQQLPDDEYNAAIDEETRKNMEILFTGIIDTYSKLTAPLPGKD